MLGKAEEKVDKQYQRGPTANRKRCTTARRSSGRKSSMQRHRRQQPTYGWRKMGKRTTSN